MSRPLFRLLLAPLVAAALVAPARGGVEALPELAWSLTASVRPKIPKTLTPLRPIKPVEVEVTVVADAACLLSVDGGAAIALEENVPIEVEMAAGSRRLSARSTVSPTAEWTATVAIEAPKPRKVRIAMLKAIRETHLKERREGVFRDEKTALMWARRDNGLDIAWAPAAAYCERSTLAGFEDWRLPSLAELESIHAVWSRREFKIADSIALTGCCPWSSDRDGDEKLWNFNYRFRKPFLVSGRLSLGLRALCVRVAPEEEPTTPEQPSKPQAPIGPAETSEPPGSPGP